MVIITYWASLFNKVYICYLGFQVLEAAPDSHKFKLTMFQPTDPQHFYRTVRKEMKLLNTSLPPGIWVRGYEDRMVSLTWNFISCPCLSQVLVHRSEGVIERVLLQIIDDTNEDEVWNAVILVHLSM